jgi:hypothetical protein
MREILFLLSDYSDEQGHEADWSGADASTSPLRLGSTTLRPKSAAEIAIRYGASEA